MLPSQSSSVPTNLLLPICWRDGDDLELSAVRGSFLPVSSQVLRFQAMLFEEMGDGLEDTLMWRFGLSSSLKMAFTKITRSTRGTRSTRNTRGGKSTRKIPDKEGRSGTCNL